MIGYFPSLVGSIAIVTYGRSGSTLLQRIVQTIPGSCIRGENSGTIVPLYRAFSRAAHAHKVFGSQVTDQKNPWFGAEDISVDAFGRALAEGFIRHVLNPPAHSRWIGFKEIRFAELGDDFEGCMDFIRAFFPNPYMLFNIRDADEVSRSGWHEKSEKDEVKQMVGEMDSRFRAYAAKHGDQTFIANHRKTVDEPKYLGEFFSMIEEYLDMSLVKLVLSERLDH